MLKKIIINLTWTSQNKLYSTGHNTLTALLAYKNSFLWPLQIFSCPPLSRSVYLYIIYYTIYAAAIIIHMIIKSWSHTEKYVELTIIVCCLFVQSLMLYRNQYHIKMLYGYINRKYSSDLLNIELFNFLVIITFINNGFCLHKETY